MFILQEMIEKSLLFRNSTFSTPLPNPNTSSKILSLTNLQSKATDRWNQLDLAYFDLHLDRVYGEGKIVSVGKDIYYRNVVLFVQRLQSLVTFKEAVFVKANVVISL